VTEYDPLRLLRVLDEHDVDFVVIGGVAARLQGAPILTQDVDVTPAIDDENLERLARASRTVWTSPSKPGSSLPLDPGR
jgi:hypothetical protein